MCITYFIVATRRSYNRVASLWAVWVAKSCDTRMDLRGTLNQVQELLKNPPNILWRLAMYSDNRSLKMLRFYEKFNYTHSTLLSGTSICSIWHAFLYGKIVFNFSRHKICVDCDCPRCKHCLVIQTLYNLLECLTLKSKLLCKIALDAVTHQRHGGGVEMLRWTVERSDLLRCHICWQHASFK